MTKKLIFATRPSALARWQTQYTIQLLQNQWDDLICDEVVIITKGDRVLDKPLPEIGGKGLFTFELEQALLEKRVDAAVHSLKDLPTEDSPGLTIGVIPLRADIGDVLICPAGYTLDELPVGAVVGTSSTRRRAQVLAYRPDLQVAPIRGNVDTRIRKAIEGRYDAVILAAAGVTRLGLQEHITQYIPFEIMSPAPGQGALAVQCRADDENTLHLLEAIEHQPTRLAVMAERAFLAALGGGCSLPVGAISTVEGGTIRLQGVVVAPHGSRVLRVSASGDDPQILGEGLAQQALVEGASDLLSQGEINMRVLITRPREQASEFAEELQNLGAQVVFLPTIEIKPIADTAPLDEALSRLDCYDWLILTSGNAVDVVLGRLTALGVGAPPQTLRVAAVGPKTAAKLEEGGFPVDFVPDEYVTEAILPGLGDLCGRWVLLPTADIAHDTLPKAIQAADGIAHVITAYHTVPATPDPEGVAALRAGVDVITFTSGSTARNFYTLAQNAGLDPYNLPGDPMIACIGPKTAKVAQETGFRVDVIADDYTIEGLISALARLQVTGSTFNP
ncbi:MAG: hydroxymethylbilane synthase [Anaerolineales bacterium]|nr:hydroxymethylbilane synthase [Anaerolineales bacterium]